MNEHKVISEATQEKSREEKYNEAILNFQCEHHCSPRKAKRAFAAMMRKKVKTFVKQGKVRKNFLTENDMLIDPTEA